jgi:rRNA processing protein Krr1/Pno1
MECSADSYDENEDLSDRMRDAHIEADGSTRRQRDTLVRVADEVKCIRRILRHTDPGSFPEVDICTQGGARGLHQYNAQLPGGLQGHAEGKGRGGGKGKVSTSTIEFDPKLTGRLIGTKGTTIRKMQAESGARIDVKDGVVSICGTPEQIKFADDAVLEILKSARSKSARSKSYGIVLWRLIDGAWCMLLQLSYSTGKHDIKIDPLRGNWKPGESRWSTACREVSEETAELLRIDPMLLASTGAQCVEGLFHVRACFENDAEQYRLLEAYDSNRQSIMGGLLGAERALLADRPAEPLALVWLDPSCVTQDHHLPLRDGLCSPSILKRSQAEMAALLHRQRRAQLREYPQDWQGMAKMLAKQARDLLDQGQIDLRLLSSTCRLQLEFSMNVPVPASTVPEALLHRIDTVLSRSTRLLGSGAVKITELPLDDLHATMLALCGPLRTSADLVAEAARHVLCECTKMLSPEDAASSCSTTLPDTLEAGLDFGDNACDIAVLNMARFTAAVQPDQLDQPDLNGHDEQESEAQPPTLAEPAAAA